MTYYEVVKKLGRIWGRWQNAEDNGRNGYKKDKNPYLTPEKIKENK